MSDIKIEKGFAIPKEKRAKYPFREMEIGDSFRVELSERSRITAAAWAVKYYEIIVRTIEDENGDKYVRVWRVK